MFGKQKADVCPFCGSHVCLIQSPKVCRHTRRIRKAIEAPAQDKMLRAPAMKK